MVETPLIIFAIIFLLIILGGILVFFVWKQKKEEKHEEPNYYAFFVMGMIWLPVGLIYMVATMTLAVEIPFLIGIPLFSIGLIYFVIGSANRDKWAQ